MKNSICSAMRLCINHFERMTDGNEKFVNHKKSAVNSLPAEVKDKGHPDLILCARRAGSDQQPPQQQAVLNRDRNCRIK